MRSSKKNNLVRRWRHSLQMTQAEFGKHVGRTGRTVAGWEKEQNPEKLPIPWLARVLGVSEERFRNGPGSREEWSHPEREAAPEPAPVPHQVSPGASALQKWLSVDSILPYYCLSDIRES